MRRYYILSVLLLFLAPNNLFAGGHKGDEPKNENAVSKTEIAPLAQPLNWFTATDQGDGTIQLQWNSAASLTGMQYLVEHSTDGLSFTTIASLPAAGSRFMFLANNAQTEGTMYYRISAKKGALRQVVSQSLEVGAPAGQQLKVTAEETLDGLQLQLNIFTKTAQSGALKILDGQGALVRQENILLNDGYNRVMLADYQQLQSGAYYLTLQTPEGISALKLER